MLFPEEEEEEEILLEPELELRVQSVIEAKLTVIKLEVLDMPLLLQDVFESGAKGSSMWCDVM